MCVWCVQNYYKQQNLLQEQSQSGKKKAASSQRKKSEKESLYYKLRLDDEIFNNRYRVAGVRLGRVTIARFNMAV